MKILIAGANGQLGRELVRQGAGHNLLAVDYDQLDITNLEAVSRCFDAFKPDVVMNAAAYTAVDRAESDIEAAFAVNRDGPANLAMMCKQLSIPLIHYSTDYVFDGSKSSAYEESDLVAPLGVYGESKRAGETAVAKYCSKYLIFRTSWVFSSHGNNFVKTMLRLGGEREELAVVADQFGKPTSAQELARITFEVLSKADGQWGIYHLAQPDAVSWHSFAEAIFSEACHQGYSLRVKHVRSITTAEYPTPAKRPKNSALNCQQFQSVFGVRIRSWSDSLAEVIKEMKNG